MELKRQRLHSSKTWGILTKSRIGIGEMSFADMDINIMRELEAKVNEIPLCEEKLTFFYDETGNCGKFLLRDNGVNDPSALKKDFILGGIVFEKEPSLLKVEQLVNNLNIQSSELKFRNLYRAKDFMTFMGTACLCTFLDWLNNNEVYIHYITLNNLYFALVDFVDSIWGGQEKFMMSPEWIFQLKSALFSFCKNNINETIALMYQYHYPNLEKNKTREFCNDFCDFILCKNDGSTPQGFFVECFRQMLKQVGKAGELTFLYDNKTNVLVEEYYTLYQSRCYTYKYSIHHFDYEKVILSKLEQAKMIDDGKEFINYDFLDSKKNLFIQLSDVVVGLLSKLFEYLDDSTFEEIQRIDRAKFSSQICNFAKINALINRADKKHKMLIQNINDINLVRQRMLKLELLSRE